MDDVAHHSVKFWFSKRFFVSIFMFLGTFHMLSITVNLNIAIVTMTSNRTITLNETIVQEPEFEWNSKTKGFILSVFSYGCLAAIFGSSLAMKIGGSTVIGVAIMASSIVTILSPFIVRFNFYVYVVARMIEGFCEGLTYVSLPELWAKWAPIEDRSKLISIAFWGCHVAALVAYPICGYTIRMFGWPAAFYVTGGSSLIWSLLWLTFVANDPISDKWISDKEKAYILKNRNEKQKPKLVIPVLKHILKSRCILALGICKFACEIGTTFVITCLPLYIKDITGVEIHKIGLLSALPNTLCILTIPLLGYILDYIHNEKILTPTQTHKLFISSGYTIGAILLLSISFLRLSFPSTMFCFVVLNVALTINSTISQIACIHLAPQCASLVAGYMQLFFSAAYIIGPVSIGFIVTHNQPEEWNLCISLTAIVLLFSAITYATYGSAETQPWSYSEQSDDPSTH